jgi:ribonuclease Z
MNRWLRWGLIALVIVAALLGAGAFIVLKVPAVQDALFDRMARAALLRDRSAILKDDALRVFVCGSSSPMPDPRRAQACIGVIAGGKIYIVDTGSGSQRNLAVWGVPIQNIGGVFLTHFHSDHIGDLGEINMNSWALGRKAPLDVYGPPGVERVVAGFSEAYALDQTYRTAHHGAELMAPDTWKMVAHPIALQGEPTSAKDRSAVAFDDGTLKVTAIEVNHAPVEPAYGYRFDYKGRSVVISGDTAPHEPLAKAAKDADVLFHEAQGQEMVKKLQAIANDAGNERLAHILHDIQSYHASPVDAAKLANEANVKLLVFYHFTPPIQNMVAKAMLTRGVSEVRPNGCLVSRDGTLIELPLGSKLVRTSSLVP